ncbi:hypothetical protein BJY01DRAFT_213621 [Aspergillus pseudoustus]|uniref:Uncharacterized protein n=1 Tax=Aspergillus pseudoustus TaxID=1810923 RepID=A0ABR4K1B3_9EURO
MAALPGLSFVSYSAIPRCVACPILNHRFGRVFLCHEKEIFRAIPWAGVFIVGSWSLCFAHFRSRDSYGLNEQCHVRSSTVSITDVAGMKRGCSLKALSRHLHKGPTGYNYVVDLETLFTN